MNIERRYILWAPPANNQDNKTLVVTKRKPSPGQLALAERNKEHKRMHQHASGTGKRKRSPRISPSNGSIAMLPVSSQHVTQIEWCRNLPLPLLGCKHVEPDGMTLEHLTSLLSLHHDTIAKTMVQKLNAGQVLSLTERAYVLRTSRGVYKEYQPNPASATGWMSITDRIRLKKLCLTSPNFVARSFTLSGKRHTNGHATETVFSPSGALDGRQCYRDIWDIPYNQLAPMLGDHLAWRDRIQDELLSWTNSWLFAVVHVYLRHLKGEGDAYLSCIDRRKATKLPNESGAQERAEFFYALSLCNAANVPNNPWCSRMKGALAYRKFVHEYLTHGVVEWSGEHDLQPVCWEDLFRNGIFFLIPEMRIPSDMMAQGLFVVLLYLRRVNYHTVVPISEEELDAAENLARLHTRGSHAQTPSSTRPPLAIFVYYLTLRKRGCADRLFQDKIRHLGYSRQDLNDVLYSSYEKLPDNLPEQASFLDLLRNVQAVVGGAPLKPDKLITQDSDSNQAFLTAEKYAKAHALLSFDPIKEGTLCKNGSGTKFYVPDRLCHYSCRCTVWKRDPKRRKKKGKAITHEPGHDSDNSPDDTDEDDHDADNESYHDTHEETSTVGEESDSDRQAGESADIDQSEKFIINGRQKCLPNSSSLEEATFNLEKATFNQHHSANKKRKVEISLDVEKERMSSYWSNE